MAFEEDGRPAVGEEAAPPGLHLVDRHHCGYRHLQFIGGPLQVPLAQQAIIGRARVRPVPVLVAVLLTDLVQHCLCLGARQAVHHQPAALLDGAHRLLGQGAELTIHRQ